MTKSAIAAARNLPVSGRRPVVLIHGYSAQGSDFRRWKEILPASAYHVHIGDYVSLTNEVSIKDIAEGFDRALDEAFLPNATFDAIVHSTGMLVLRCWLTIYPERGKRLKHLIALAPATNGSPLAHKGRSWLGAIFKGNKTTGPDFLEAGDKILDALELGSLFTWELAERDLFGGATYGADAATPYVFVFCGADDYQGVRSLINEPGTDGTVRWAGCSLNSRKITLDLAQPDAKQRAVLKVNNNVAWMPLVLLDDLNHATIVSKPSEPLTHAVLEALKVESADQYAAWCERVQRIHSADQPEFQQFVLRLVDERGDPITDYHIQCFEVDVEGKWRLLAGFTKDVHAYARDSSLRNFHVQLDPQLKRATRLGIRLTASSGTPLVQYTGFGDNESWTMDSTPMAATQVELTFPTALTTDTQRASFFAPYTTTFIELKMNREPSLHKVFSFLTD